MDSRRASSLGQRKSSVHDRREWKVDSDREDAECFSGKYGAGEENWLEDVGWRRVRASRAWAEVRSSAIRICPWSWVDSGLIIVLRWLLNSCRSFSLT